LTASKALRYRSPLKSSDKLEKLVRNIEKVADISDSDKVWADEVRNIQDYLRDN
jgi:histidine ammonia-lyase